MKKKLKITNHSLMPKHVKLNEKEKKELLQKYNITINELPKILVKDPSIEHLNPIVGDIIMIIRNSPTAGESVFFRGVTNG